MDVLNGILQNAADPIIALRVLVGALLVNVGFAVILALKNKQFDWAHLNHYLGEDVIGYGGGLAIVWLASLVDPALQAAFVAAADGVTVYYGKRILEKVAKFFAGAKVPPNPPGSP